MKKSLSWIIARLPSTVKKSQWQALLFHLTVPKKPEINREQNRYDHRVITEVPYRLLPLIW